MPRGDQVSRQWRILQMLEAKRMGISVPDLASELETNPRTIYRDMEALEMAGFPIYCEKIENVEKWFFVEGYRSKIPIPLEMTEIMALSLACEHLEAFRGTIFSESMKSAFDKVRSMLSPEAHNFLQGLSKSFRVGFAGKKDYNKHRATVDLIQKALIERTTVAIQYASSKGEVTSRKIDPYHVWFMGGTIYIVARCHHRGEVRLFVLDRIEKAKLTADTFEIPSDFCMDEFTKGRFRVMDGDPVEIRIRFTKNLAQYVKERIWHPTQSISDESDGSIVLTMTVEGMAEVKSWVLSFGANAEVLSPKKFRTEMAGELSRAAGYYS